MSDTPVAQARWWYALAKSSLTSAFAELDLSGTPVSLVMVGLMGEPPWFRRDGDQRGFVARLRAMTRMPLRVRSAAVPNPPRMPGHRAQGVLDPWTGEHATPARFLIATLLVVAATGVSLLLRPYLQVGSLVLPFLVAILLAAIALGLLPSLFASVLSVAAFDYLFLPPFYSLTISDPDDVTRLVIFALTALIVSNLAAYARRQAVTASRRAEIAEDLYSFGRQLTGAATLHEVLNGALPRLGTILQARIQIVLAAGSDRSVTLPSGQENAPEGPAIAGTEFAQIKSWLQSGSTSDTDPHPLPVSETWLFVPMLTGRGKAGVLAIARDDVVGIQLPNPDALFGTLADLLAQAVDRINLVNDLNEASRAAEREELYAVMLASLSHDLRTPLASVLGSTETLLALDPGAGNDKRESLALAIQEDARRLNRYLGNVLDMTRLEAGVVGTTFGGVDLTDVVSAALDRCVDALSNHRVSVQLDSDLPFLAGDEVALEHVLFNLLDNAAKYTAPGSLVQLRALRRSGSVVIEVTDEGEGIRPEDLERIFDKFYRASHDGPQRSGIGLGLAICRGYVEAMGGRIIAGNRTDRAGAVFNITMPIPAGSAPPGHTA
jgi:two-component system, OmpR family, sensor histidine kinase KdpD